MKPAVDEMFPEGAGPYVDLDEILKISLMTMISSEVCPAVRLPRLCHDVVWWIASKDSFRWFQRTCGKHLKFGDG
ncbi:COP9 signalosome complex subunit 9 isoform X1 [Monodon monoceros]|uniref:COP9 signalosome complex subunit 9 isoform X1 n=1 Tax=Monodon monoceros TaxID=40151 RepID=UPI000BB88E42|nr:COP9 signalosome complex subunit 9 isoform X1 [Monodon monoceros]